MDTDRFPSPEQGVILHARLLANDPVASRDLCRLYLAPLTACLARRFPRDSADLRQTAAHDALLSLLHHPDRYDPARGDLATYLRMAAGRDLLNLRKREQRQLRLIDPGMPVELAADLRNHLSGGPLGDLLTQEQGEADRRFLDAARASFSPDEQAVLALMLGGERRTSAFAAVLGLSDRPPEEQERAVKRVKDRIRMRLKRGGHHDRTDRSDGAAGAA